MIFKCCNCSKIIPATRVCLSCGHDNLTEAQLKTLTACLGAAFKHLGFSGFRKQRGSNIWTVDREGCKLIVHFIQREPTGKWTVIPSDAKVQGIISSVVRDWDALDRQKKSMRRKVARLL